MKGHLRRFGFLQGLTLRITTAIIACGLAISSGRGWAAGAASASETTGGPRWERDLLPDKAPAAGTPGFTRAALGRFQLDSSLLAHTRDDFADLRLFDAGGKAIGIQVRPVEGRERRCAEAPVPMQRLSLQVLGDTAFEAVFLAEDSLRRPDRIIVSIEAKDFEISLSLWTAPGLPLGNLAGSAGPAGPARPESTSVDGWTLRLGGVPLFDYSRIVDLRREDARWPAGPDRAVRLRVNGLTQRQRSLVSTLSGHVGRPDGESFQMERKLLRVEAISFSGEVCAEERGTPVTDTVVLPSPGFASPVREADAKRSWFLFPAGRIPLKTLLPQVGTRSFLRSVIVTGLTDSLIDPLDSAARPWTWPRVADARLHRIDWAGPVDSLLRIPLPSGRFATLALGVLDHDDAPLILEGMAAETDRLEALFPLPEKPTTEDRYLLSYGDPGAEPRHFDFESLLASNPQSVPRAFADFHAGAPRALQQAPALSGLPASRFPWLTGQVVLTVGLALAIVGLLALVFLVARKVEKQT